MRRRASSAGKLSPSSLIQSLHKPSLASTVCGAPGRTPRAEEERVPGPLAGRGDEAGAVCSRRGVCLSAARRQPRCFLFSDDESTGDSDAASSPRSPREGLFGPDFCCWRESELLRGGSRFRKWTAGWAECRTVRQTAWGQVPAGFCEGPVASPSLFLHCDCRAVPFSQGFSAVGCVREFVVQIAKCYARKINK